MWLISNPITWVIGGIAALVTILDIAITSTEEYKEKLDDLKNEYSEIVSQIESVNSELATTTQRMKELEKIKKENVYERGIKTNQLHPHEQRGIQSVFKVVLKSLCRPPDKIR